MSPTQRTLAYLRERGYLCDVVERWIPGANIRKDLFGIFDIVAISTPSSAAIADSLKFFPCTTIGVQCTSSSNVSARVKKMLASEFFEPLHDADWGMLVLGWTKGKKEPRVEVL